MSATAHNRQHREYALATAQSSIDLGERRALVLDRPGDLGQPPGVVIGQCRMIDLIEVARLVLGIEVIERTQQKLPFAFKFGQQVGIKRCLLSVGAAAHGSLGDASPLRISATSARSSSPTSSTSVGQLPPKFIEERECVFFGVTEHDADQLHVVVLVATSEFDEFRVLDPAPDAPRGKEVHDNPVATFGIKSGVHVGVVGELDRFVLDKGQFGLTQVAVAGGKGDGHDDHTKVDDHAAVGAANQPAPAVAAGREHDLAKRRACGKPGKRERNQRGQAARTNYHCSNKRCGGEPGRPFQASAQQFPAGLAPWAAPERPPSETT
ncbi:hypothetical protein GQR58_028479 [Nymphon striatum]|nr:hypothetical protein GQR58_028479 [Nymphon striatum]